MVWNPCNKIIYHQMTCQMLNMERVCITVVSKIFLQEPMMIRTIDFFFLRTWYWGLYQLIRGLQCPPKIYTLETSMVFPIELT